jgi:hypothetical protein
MQNFNFNSFHVGVKLGLSPNGKSEDVWAQNVENIWI